MDKMSFVIFMRLPKKISGNSYPTVLDVLLSNGLSCVQTKLDIFLKSLHRVNHCLRRQ